MFSENLEIGRGNLQKTYEIEQGGKFLYPLEFVSR